VNWRVRLVSLFIVLLFGGFGFYYYHLYVAPKTHGIILFIAPGLSPELLALAENTRHGNEFKALSHPNRVLLFNNRGSDGVLCDYPRLMSRIATGKPGYPQRLALNLDGRRDDTLFYAAQRARRNIGLVSSTSVFSPGVAAFYAHTGQPDDPPAFAHQLLDNTRIDVILGGGSAVFRELTLRGGRDLLAEARKSGFAFTENRGELDKFQAWRFLTPLLGLYGDERLPWSYTQDSSDPYSPPSLADMTRRAIEKLQYNFGGYFLVVEHGLVAEAARGNFASKAVNEVIALDEAIQAARLYGGRNVHILVLCPFSIGGLQLPVEDSAAIPSPSWHNGPGAVPPGTTHAQPDDLPPLLPAGFPLPAAAPTSGYGWLFSFGPAPHDFPGGTLDAVQLHDLIQRQF
jgi:alkaline phosphatase